ncbi:MAG: alkaline phosphatase family protein, partial [Chloroflexota bacterium]
PEFTVAYFPDNDFDSHTDGPQQAVATLEQVDAYVGELIEVCGGLDTMLQEFCVIITGDHAQSDMITDREEAGINLEKLLSEFNVADAGTPMSDDEQLVICPNLRVAQLYFRQPTRGPVEKVVAQLLSEPRIDQVMWSAETTGERKPGYYVTTRSRGTVRFWPSADSPYAVADQYGTKWEWDGSLTAVDGQIENKSLLTFPTYPNAFERIAGGLNVPEGGHLWVTALPGYEFRLSGMKVHTGGSHGTLHDFDSTVPLIAAGLPGDLHLPHHMRSVDVAPLCAAVLGIQVGSSIGKRHIRYS